MATKKFCENCGGKCTDSKCPKCDKNADAEINTSSSFNFQDIVAVYKNILPRPVSTIRSLIKKQSMGLSWVLIAVASILSGLASYFIFMRASTLAGNNTLFLDSFWTIFFTAAVLDILIYILLAFWSMVFVGRAFKGGGSFKDYLAVIAGASAFTVLFSIINIVLGLANLTVIAGVLQVFAAFTAIILIIQGFNEIAKSNDNTFAYGISLAVIVTGIIAAFIAYFAVYQLGVNISTNAINKTYNSTYEDILKNWGY
ncbi:YIP1 family protein [Candidatus Saccharibacteria bacterium]|nr:YIP1 family protein [Candidatus Saccharibacteria bacterium]